LGVPELRDGGGACVHGLGGGVELRAPCPTRA
jgi:hypothetical protein